MNLQETFNTSLAHLRAQGQRAIGKNGMCAYRGLNNTKCAIGALIPDSKYDESIEGLNVFDPHVVDALNGAFYDPQFYIELQRNLHDFLSDENYPGDLEIAAQDLAKKWNLNYA